MMAMTGFNLHFESDEEAKQSCAEKLFMFLYNAKAHHRAAELSHIFNAEFPFEKIMETCRDVLRDSEQEYADVVSNNAITVDGERHIHISDFAVGTVEKRKVNRCLEKMPSTVSRSQENCPLHSKRCRLIPFYYGFLCFLNLHIDDSELKTAQLPTRNYQARLLL